MAELLLSHLPQSLTRRKEWTVLTPWRTLLCTDRVCAAASSLWSCTRVLSTSHMLLCLPGIDSQLRMETSSAFLPTLKTALSFYLCKFTKMNSKKEDHCNKQYWGPGHGLAQPGVWFSLGPLLLTLPNGPSSYTCAWQAPQSLCYFSIELQVCGCHLQP